MSTGASSTWPCAPVIRCHPDEVDQAWHLHLLHSEEYWRRFCPDTLGRDLHHYPTQGGPAERAKSLAWYENTLDSYRRLFGAEPPADIWPDPDTRFGAAAEQRRTALRAWTARRGVRRDAAMAAVGSVVTGCIGYLGISSEAPEHIKVTRLFLPLFAVLAALATLFSWRLQRGRKRSGKGRRSGGDLDDLDGDGGHSVGDASGCGSGCGGG